MPLSDTYSDQQFWYCHSGVNIASGLELPEWRSFECSADDPVDVEIRLAPSGEPFRHAGAHGIYTNGCLQFSVREVASWAISEGRKIVISPAPDAELAHIRLFTLGSAWGALGYQRGWAMLHGSGVTFDRRTALFCGEAGQGKSTMAAALVERGGTLVADDLSRVDPLASDLDSGCGIIHPSSNRIKLNDAAMRQFDWSTDKPKSAQDSDGKSQIVLDRVQLHREPAALTAIFALSWGGAIELERLRGADAVRALTEATMYRKEYLELMGCLGEQVVHCACLASSIPIYRLTRPRDFTQIAAVCQLVETTLLQLESDAK